MVDVQTSSAPDAATDPDQEPSLGDLLGQLSADFSAFISTQVELAKTEIRAEAAKAARATGMLGAAGVAALLAILLLSFAVAWGLAAVMPAGWAFLIVGVLWGAAAAVLFAFGREQVRAVRPVPPATKQSIEEDLAWARQQKN